MNVEVWPTVAADGRRWRESDPGYADAFKALCGQVVVATREGLSITLERGEIEFNPTLDEVHVEIALLRVTDGQWMCWRPGEESFEHLS